MLHRNDVADCQIHCPGFCHDLHLGCISLEMSHRADLQIAVFENKGSMSARQENIFTINVPPLDNLLDTKKRAIRIVATSIV